MTLPFKTDAATTGTSDWFRMNSQLCPFSTLQISHWSFLLSSSSGTSFNLTPPPLNSAYYLLLIEIKNSILSELFNSLLISDSSNFCAFCKNPVSIPQLQFSTPYSTLHSVAFIQFPQFRRICQLGHHVFDALNNKTLVANKLAAELTCGDTTTVSCIDYFHETAGEREPFVAVFKDFARISERCQPLVSWVFFDSHESREYFWDF